MQATRTPGVVLVAVPSCQVCWQFVPVRLVAVNCGSTESPVVFPLVVPWMMGVTFNPTNVVLPAAGLNFPPLHTEKFLLEPEAGENVSPPNPGLPARYRPL